MLDWDSPRSIHSPVLIEVSSTGITERLRFMHQAKSLLKSASFVAIAGLTLSTGAVVVVADGALPVASAQETTPGIGNIDPNHAVTLTINKRINPETLGGPATGQEQENVQGNPL